MDPGEQPRSAGRRLAEPLESLAQSLARRVTEMLIEALDVNALLDRIDVNKLLDRIDVNRLLDRVDLDSLAARADIGTLLSRLDVNELASRVDVDALLERTEFRALIARSSSTVASEGVDLVRSQAVGLDDFFARWVSRLRRRSYAGPPAPAAPAAAPRPPAALRPGPSRVRR